ncbi:hypothetical protein N7468_003716 [Penicillium chermesinum]|uniref:Uncharacterized protein n=1 Tax=Penicillium chermesinum TaxID=63820 RepID=A0A9W9P9V5_9EURO|nr:uncharacterized protein N7468_003716 [Penicillium chermesinum]KAJ5239097.1 hypothetical protein N7468_003716 [Penicillium chermesinum]
MDSQSATLTDYNETLRKVGGTISNSLQNALSTFGAASAQYQVVMEILKDCLKEIEEKKASSQNQELVDSDMLATAMGFLTI